MPSHLIKLTLSLNKIIERKATATYARETMGYANERFILDKTASQNIEDRPKRAKPVKTQGLDNIGAIFDKICVTWKEPNSFIPCFMLNWAMTASEIETIINNMLVIFYSFCFCTLK